MVNPGNFKVGIGRLTDDVKVFDNTDGSRKVRFTLAETDNFKANDGTRGTQFIPYEQFIGAGKGLGVYEKMHKGDLVEIISTAKNNNYTDKAGNQVYGIVFSVEQINLLESKTVTDARQAARAAAEAAPAPATEA